MYGHGALRSITGLPFSTYFSGVKVKWMYENVLEVRKAIDDGDAMIGTVDSWIVYNLTGGCGNGGIHITDGAKSYAAFSFSFHPNRSSSLSHVSRCLTYVHIIAHRAYCSNLPGSFCKHQMMQKCLTDCYYHCLIE
jgi:glycerol kinase